MGRPILLSINHHLALTRLPRHTQPQRCCCKPKSRRTHPLSSKVLFLNRTLGGVEQLDFSANQNPPALPSVATTTTAATLAPPPGAGHVGPTNWATPDVAQMVSMAECQMNGLESAEASKSIGVPSNCQKKRQIPQGQCTNFVWTADDDGKDGSQGNCHTLPNDMEADCWNIWVHG